MGMTKRIFMINLTKAAGLATVLFALVACGRGNEEPGHPAAQEGGQKVAEGKADTKENNASRIQVSTNTYKDTQGPYGAMAMVKVNDKAIGFAGYDEPDEATARKLALDGCREEAGNAGAGCKVTLVFRHACGAFASAPNGGYGTGWGDSPALACKWALKSCKDSNDRGCLADAYICSPGGKQGFCDGGLVIEGGTTTMHAN
jgi:hypothetical protein